MWISEAERSYRAGQERAWRKIHPRRKNKKQKLAKRKAKEQLRRTEQEASIRAQRFLHDWWGTYNAAKDKEGRIACLRHAANPPWPRVPEPVYRRLKSTYIRVRSKLMPEELECGACMEAIATERHHVIPSTFGGPNIAYNLLKICIGCHAEIHPWLKC